jgi:hypothetical protein
MTAGQIERAKLTASFLNSLASGTILAAIVAPYIGWGLGTLSLSADLWGVAGLSAFGFVVGMMLHLFALRALGGIDA